MCTLGLTPLLLVFIIYLQSYLSCYNNGVSLNLHYDRFQPPFDPDPA
jgi:hypothetical protein